MELLLYYSAGLCSFVLFLFVGRSAFLIEQKGDALHLLSVCGQSDDGILCGELGFLELEEMQSNISRELGSAIHPC